MTTSRWLMAAPHNLVFCIAFILLSLILGAAVNIGASKKQRIAAVGLMLGAIPPALLLSSLILPQFSVFISDASDLSWAPILACLAWAGLAIWPGTDTYRSVTALPLIAMLLYLFRLTGFATTGPEAIAIYASLAVLPMILTAVLGSGQGRWQMGMGGVLYGWGLGGGFWLNQMTGELLPFYGDMIWLTLPGIACISWGFRIHRS